MRNLIRSGLAAGMAGALALAGIALAQQGSTPPSGSSGAGTPSSGSAAGGTSGSAGSSDTAKGGGGPSAGSDQTATGAPSAGKKVDKELQGKLERIHADNQGEIQLAQVAEQNAQSPEVKQFAQQMAADHSRLDGKLQQTAQSMGITSLEGKDFQKAMQENQKDAQKLQTKTGKDFDKGYMSRMVKDHEKDLKVVKDAQKAAEKGKHVELAALLGGAHAGMQKHLDHAKQVEKAVKSGTSAAAGGTPGSTSGTGTSGGAGTSGGTGTSGGKSSSDPSKPPSQ
jgi:putative membrane protein